MMDEEFRRVEAELLAALHFSLSRDGFVLGSRGDRLCRRESGIWLRRVNGVANKARGAA